MNDRHVKVDDTISSPSWGFGNFPSYNVEKKVSCPPRAYHPVVGKRKKKEKHKIHDIIRFSSAQSFSRVRPFATP